jgi:hypothetical protein
VISRLNAVSGSFWRGLAGAFWLGAAVTAFLGVRTYVESRSFVSRGVEVRATVTDCRSNRRSVRSHYWVCRYVYQPLSRGPLYSKPLTGGAWSPGDTVWVRYLPEDPATSATVQSLQGISLVRVGGISAVLVILGAMTAYIERRLPSA